MMVDNIKVDICLRCGNTNQDNFEETTFQFEEELEEKAYICKICGSIYTEDAYIPNFDKVIESTMDNVKTWSKI